MFFYIPHSRENTWILIKFLLSIYILTSSTSSICSIKRIFVTEYVYPEWFTKKKYQFYKSMEERLQKLIYIHTMSSDYYDKLNFRIFAPSISITAISSIASFLSTSEFVDNDTQNAFGVGVGVMASISAMLQSMGSAMRFNAKTEAHGTAADQYNRLLVRLKFEMEMPNEEDFTDIFLHNL
jgi:hypothetical protein